MANGIKWCFKQNHQPLYNKQSKKPSSLKKWWRGKAFLNVIESWTDVQKNAPLILEEVVYGILVFQLQNAHAFFT